MGMSGRASKRASERTSIHVQCVANKCEKIAGSQKQFRFEKFETSA